MDRSTETKLLELEREFWQGDAGFYREHLADDSLMVFAMPIGVLTKDEAIHSINHGPRWNEVTFSEVRWLPLSDTIAAIIYRASALRLGGATAHTTFASSVYTRQDGSWKLAFHQQTPDPVSY